MTMAAHTHTYTVTQPYFAAHNELGEGPYWDEPARLFRWVDIVAGEVHTINVDQGPSSHRLVGKADFPIGLTANIKGRRDAFLIAGKPYIGVMDAATGSCTPLADSLTEQLRAKGLDDRLRFNDGAVDPRGRLWVGTMVSGEGEIGRAGSLYRIDADLSVHLMVENAGIPNGTSWTADHRHMYWTDTVDSVIYSFDYDVDTGSVSNRRPFIEFDPSRGRPDGHCIDAEGHLWVALWGGSRVVRVSPAGKTVAEIQLPTRCITCPRFVGEELYIVTAREPQPDEHAESAKQGGNVFKVHVGVRGAPVYDFVLDARAAAAR